MAMGHSTAALGLGHEVDLAGYTFLLFSLTLLAFGLKMLQPKTERTKSREYDSYRMKSWNQ